MRDYSVKRGIAGRVRRGDIIMHSGDGLEIGAYLKMHEKLVRDGLYLGASELGERIMRDASFYLNRGLTPEELIEFGKYIDGKNETARRRGIINGLKDGFDDIGRYNWDNLRRAEELKKVAELMNASLNPLPHAKGVYRLDTMRKPDVDRARKGIDGSTRECIEIAREVSGAIGRGGLPDRYVRLFRKHVREKFPEAFSESDASA